MQLVLTILETMIVKNTVNLQDCAIACNIKHYSCNAFKYEANFKKCHLVSVIFIDRHQGTHILISFRFHVKLLKAILLLIKYGQDE